MKKRIISTLACLAVAFCLSGMAQAADFYTTPWPESKPGLLYKLARSNERCAIYALGRGSIEVDCATMIGDGWLKGLVVECIAQGIKQVCTPTLQFNSFDTAAIKCGKVCGGTGWTYIR